MVARTPSPIVLQRRRSFPADALVWSKASHSLLFVLLLLLLSPLLLQSECAVRAALSQSPTPPKRDLQTPQAARRISMDSTRQFTKHNHPLGLLSPHQILYHASDAIEDYRPVLDASDFDSSSRLVSITDFRGETFQCILPTSADDYVDDDSSDEAAFSTTLSVQNAAQALQVISSSCYYLGTGWWTYEVCPTVHVAQYHVEKGEPQAKFSLGDSMSVQSSHMGEDSFLRLRLNNKQSIGTHYFAETYLGGDLCDLTGEPRQTEIHYFCDLVRSRQKQDLKDPKDLIQLINVDEPATCRYVLNIATPLVCNLYPFRTELPDHHPETFVHCFGPEPPQMRTRVLVEVPDPGVFDQILKNEQNRLDHEHAQQEQVYLRAYNERPVQHAQAENRQH
mmetsp:Transcript_22453/g.56325  ORF Transcript_22453/g.56325 Transcript_22453/m.56325 type:complete len:393 (-) Transcript_22453:18-1196(-)